MQQPSTDDILFAFFNLLRRHRFPLGIADYQTAQDVLRAGYGWESPEDLCQVLSLIWAKSRAENEALVAIFNQVHFSKDWQLPAQVKSEIKQDMPLETEPAPTKDASKQKQKEPSAPMAPPTEYQEAPKKKNGGLLPLVDVDLKKQYPYLLVPELPITPREVAQAWRRLRKPVRIGPLEELDVSETIRRWSRQAVAHGVVMVPRRRNITQLLLLVDQQGSMAPYHVFVRMVCKEIQVSGNFGKTSIYYFHDSPVLGTDETVIEPLLDQMFPVFDQVVPLINPTLSGALYRDNELIHRTTVKEVLDNDARGAAVVIISDAGAARGNYDAIRLLNTIAFLKALKSYTRQIVWLSPVQRTGWATSTAEQIARYVPMFVMDRRGLQMAVNVLRGHAYQVEQRL